MSTGDWLCVFMIILGVILFLAGSNIYNGIVGWAGVLLFVAGIAGLILLFVHNMMRRHGEEASKKEQSEPSSA
jgi:hypothetical protein